MRRSPLSNAVYWVITLASFGIGASLILPADSQAAPVDKNTSPIQSGERVVFIGGGFIERMQQYDWLEALMTKALQTSTFRNVGWGGDTCYGDARAVFGSRPDGYARLMRDLDLAKPNVSIVCYGENECWEGERGLQAFREAYQKLVADLKAKGSRVIIMLPRQRESTSLVEPERTAAYNKALKMYNEQAKQIAAAGKFPLIDLESFQLNEKLTLDGVYWSEPGYVAVAKEICRQLNLPAESKVDTSSMADLRNKINAKNAWFFHRYRPQNETYLFLFRKHEQGNNAVELEQIDPQIEGLETQIAAAVK